jgi:hypothetical protein
MLSAYHHLEEYPLATGLQSYGRENLKSEQKWRSLPSVSMGINMEEETHFTLFTALLCDNK